MRKALIVLSVLSTFAMIGCTGSGGGGPMSPSASPVANADSSSGFPPGQFPAGNPAQAPGCSNPNTKPSDCKK